MFSVKRKRPSRKPRTPQFILEAVIPPLVIVSSHLTNWSNLFSRANLIPGTAFVVLCLVAGILIWMEMYRGE